MRVLRPVSLAEAQSMALEPGHRLTAGVTALQLQWAQGVKRPGALVDVAGLLPTMIRRDGDRVTLGAGTTLEDLRRADLPMLSAALADIAAPSVRSLGTIGGQVGWGAGCLLPALLVLDGSARTTEGDMPLADYLADPRGIVLSLSLTLPAPGARLVWRKEGLRAAFSPAMLVVAGVADDRGLRLAAGGGVVPPQRLTGAEGAALDHDTLVAAIEAAFAPPACPWRSAAWRRTAAARALAQGLAPPAPPPGPAPRPRPVARALARPMPLLPGGAGWHPRPDMAAKVAGDLAYLTDAREPGMLVGRILRAAHAHARILRIDTSAARALPGVRAVVTAADVPGLNAFGIVFPDQPAFCSDRVCYPGDAVAAVAAEDEATAEAALTLIRVEYAPLPVIDDMEAALAPDAPALHPNGNLMTEVGLTRGDLDAAFAGAAHVIEDVYVTPRQMHGFLETEGGHARVLADGTLLVCAGGQHGARDRMQLSRILNRPEDTIRIVSSPTGGAFGGKDELTVQPALALLAIVTGAPVRLHLSRAESVLAGTKRNPFRIRMRTACDAEGRLIAQEVDALADSGAYASLSPGVLETAMEHAAGPYRIANVRTRGRLVHTNNGAGGAFRGFGANQMAFAVECQIDRLAAACGLDPVEMRRRNLRAPGEPGFLGQRVAPSERLSEMLEAAAASPLWVPPVSDGDWTEGTGMALMWQGNGLGTIPVDEGAGALRLAADGAIEVLCGLDEMGQGLHAALVATVADRLGVARADVRPVTGDTGAAPDSGSTTASRGGYVVWVIAHRAGPGFTRQLLEGAARILGIAAEDLALMPGGVGLQGQNRPGPLLTLADLAHALTPSGLPVQTIHFEFPKTDYTAGNARFIFCGGATVARVAVSRATGAVRVRALEVHTAAGPVIDLAAYLGQMEGGAVQGLGFTLSEDVPMPGGWPMARNLDTYAMPGIRDVPPVLRVTALSDLDPGDPYGPRGAGELGIGGVTPAIANALADALGRWPAVTPIPPDWAHEAMP